MTTLSAIQEKITGPLRNLKAWLLAAAVCTAGALVTLPVEAASHKLDNASCQDCHSGKKGKLEAKGTDGEKRELFVIENEKYGKGVHAKMECVACHTEIVDSKANHKIDPKAKKPDCATCHEDLWAKAKKDGKTKEKARMGTVVENIDAYQKSFHAKENQDDETKVNATCSQCHNTHTFDIPPKDSEARKEWRPSEPASCGKGCHEDQLEEFEGSIHGEKLIDEGEGKAATCSDCHTAHSVGNTSAVTFKQKVLESCGDCHDDAFKSYERTQHGKLATHKGASTVRCMDCHGSHGIFLVTKLKDPRKMVAQDNKMCISCHTSDKKYEKFAPLKVGGKEGEKVERPDLDEQHKWLPNTKLHWQSVRCIDCHTSAEPGLSHEILGEKKAERMCVTCHTKDSQLATRLYRHLADDEKQKYGFANSVILSNSYVIGATRHPLLDTLILAMAALTFIGVLGHGLIRYLGAKKRRNNAK